MWYQHGKSCIKEKKLRRFCTYSGLTTRSGVLRFWGSLAQRCSTVPYRERGFLAHSVRRNSKSGVSEVPVRRKAGSGVFEVPVRSDTPPYLIGNEVFWRTRCAETPKTEFPRIPCAIIPLLHDMWRGRRRSISHVSGSLILGFTARVPVCTCHT